MAGSTRALRDWLAVFLYVGIIIGTAPVAPGIWKAASEFFGNKFLLIAGSMVLFFLIMWRVLYCLCVARVKDFYVYAGTALLALLTIALYGTYQVETAAEKIHFIEYGFLPFLFVRAIRNHTEEFDLFVWALIAGCSVGVIDEVAQYYLPLRVFDTADILLNAICCCLGLSIAALIPERPARGIRGEHERKMNEKGNYGYEKKE
ncbi:MAG: VanZ family protein [Candidatus Omnitrophota bacterium]